MEGMEKRFISPTEISEALSISTRAVGKLFRSGSLKAYDFAGNLRVEESDLLQFIAECAQGNEKK